MERILPPEFRSSGQETPFQGLTPLPGAIFCEESPGHVRIARNGYLSKVVKIGQVVLVGKKAVSKLGKTCKHLVKLAKNI